MHIINIQDLPPPPERGLILLPPKLRTMDTVAKNIIPGWYTYPSSESGYRCGWDHVNALGLVDPRAIYAVKADHLRLLMVEIPYRMKEIFPNGIPPHNPGHIDRFISVSPDGGHWILPDQLVIRNHNPLPIEVLL
jgi:hypothetical protein